jgi:circadian clock protein KaiB
MNPSENPDATSKESQEDKYVLKLYVAGQTSRSRRALQNLRSIGREHLADRYEIEVVDIKERPEAAEEEDIVAVPTLIKQLPPPLRRIVGDLSRTSEVLVGLDLEASE